MKKKNIFELGATQRGGMLKGRPYFFCSFFLFFLSLSFLSSLFFSMFNWYYSPLVQVTFLGLVCLCCPGIFNALSGLGAGGSMSSNVSLTDSANGALYGCFCIVGFFAGSIVNKLGIRPCLTVSNGCDFGGNAHYGRLIVVGFASFILHLTGQLAWLRLVLGVAVGL